MRNGKTNIMVVDDDARTLRMMEAMLTPQGYRVTTAKDGQEAVDLVGREKPDLVLMDMMMPRLDGLAACHAIKTNPATKQIPIIMLTAVSGGLNEQMAKEIWLADGYITKPVDLVELKTTLDHFLNAS